MRITIIGSGNVATVLAFALKRGGHEIVQVYSRTKANAIELAEQVDAKAVNEFADIHVNADLYIVSVKDDVIAKTANSFNVDGKIVVHTAGSIPMEVLKASSDNYGVFYPLQTFSKQRTQSFESIPICLEASDERTMKALKELANSISTNVTEVNSEQRKVLHLTAVFACNFVNHLYTLSEQLLKEHKLSFDYIRPLIIETAEKIKNINPLEAQTGPARRNDQQVMLSHLQMLENEPVLKSIYTLLSESIVNTYNSQQ
ncbi:Rossmann-like and DUF2520 domain-containing protein [Solitalea koreensis]|uniref:Predicted oxidoreductase, contains short-chain dehydrogenase (SDR) and DUF2520 domains n=1 Tax=Solitalea koreensis TaxID=543615 RepID=A0A521D474_9SPHI|nr:Rossmann-like and DUF2520 domain-containing protein [Solitalea koreensis]SMO65881.1 Predicted oxidoreductase, contains short-chain dehydrogenase (SDR) and DUF2520 domains [Solitalea koreensis]